MCRLGTEDPVAFRAHGVNWHVCSWSASRHEGENLYTAENQPHKKMSAWAFWGILVGVLRKSTEESRDIWGPLNLFCVLALLCYIFTVLSVRTGLPSESEGDGVNFWVWHVRKTFHLNLRLQYSHLQVENARSFEDSELVELMACSAHLLLPGRNTTQGWSHLYGLSSPAPIMNQGNSPQMCPQVYLKEGVPQLKCPLPQ